MADDGLFFRGVARVSRRTRVPTVAIALQGVFAILIAASKRYDQILNYVVSVDFIFFGLTGLSLFILRRRATRTMTLARIEETSDAARDASRFRVPGHPLTTALFVAACWLVVASTIYKSFADSVVGLLILAAGVPAYLFWSRQRRKFL
jgi:APA family basic amino acid/polyamine antiporter